MTAKLLFPLFSRVAPIPICFAAVFFIASCPSALAQTINSDQRRDLRTRIEALVDTVTTATWIQTSREVLGRDEEFVEARCEWAGQEQMRLDVTDGRGSGAAAILFSGRVYGFRRGLLSFIKRSFEPDDPAVLSLRGNSMTENGFIDDLRDAVEMWNEATIDSMSTGYLVTFEDGAGRLNRLEVAGSPLHVRRHERLERGHVVERYTYREVIYNTDVDMSRLRP